MVAAEYWMIDWRCRNVRYCKMVKFMILTLFVLVNLTEIQGITSCWLSFSSLSSGDPTHLLTLFGHRGVKMAWRPGGKWWGSAKKHSSEVFAQRPARLIRRSKLIPGSDGVHPILEGPRWVRFIPEGNLCSPKGSSDILSRKKKALKWYTRQEKVEWKPPPKSKKANPLTF